MSTKEERIAAFWEPEMTMTLPKRQVQRLYNVFKQATQEIKNRQKDLEPEEYVKSAQESFEDKSILMYLDWILKQNQEP